MALLYIVWKSIERVLVWSYGSRKWWLSLPHVVVAGSSSSCIAFLRHCCLADCCHQATWFWWRSSLQSWNRVMNLIKLLLLCFFLFSSKLVLICLDQICGCRWVERDATLLLFRRISEEPFPRPPYAMAYGRPWLLCSLCLPFWKRYLLLSFPC